MIFIAVALIVPELEEFIPLDTASGVLLLVLPIPISWATTILLHARLDTDFYLLSTKDKMIHLLSTTWFTVPVRRMEERDQGHKGRETFFAILLGGINLLGTSTALSTAQGDRVLFEGLGYFFEILRTVLYLPVLLYLIGCGLLLLFEKTVHPWRDLGKERERHCWGKLQGTKRGIEVEPTIWDQVSGRCHFSVHFYFFRMGQRRKT